MEGCGERPVARARPTNGAIAAHGSLFDACVVVLYGARHCAAQGAETSERVGALGGDVCARVVESMWRWSLVDDRTLPAVARLFGHFSSPGHLPLTVDDSFLEHLARSPAAARLVELDLSRCVGVSTEGLRALRAFPQFRRLNLAGNGLLGDMLFPVLVECCPQLEARLPMAACDPFLRGYGAYSLNLCGSDRATQDKSEQFLHLLVLTSLEAERDSDTGGDGKRCDMPLPRLTELHLEFPPLSMLPLLQQSGRLAHFQVLGRSDHVIQPRGLKLRRRAESEGGQHLPALQLQQREELILDALWNARHLRNGSVELQPAYTLRLLARLDNEHDTLLERDDFQWENLNLAVSQPAELGILRHFVRLRQLSLMRSAEPTDALWEAEEFTDALRRHSEALSGLRRLAVFQPGRLFGHQRLAEAWTAALPNLVSLSVHGELHVSALAASGLTSLTSLKLNDFADVLSLEGLWRALEALPLLQAFRLSALGTDLEGRDSSLHHVLSHRNLISFSLFAPDICRPRLACGQLRRCSISSHPLNNLAGLVTDLVANEPMLEDLRLGIISSDEQSDPAWLGRLLVGLPRLRRLALIGQTPPSDARALASMLDAACEQGLVLGELDLDCSIDADSVDALLRACPRLHSLSLSVFAHVSLPGEPRPDSPALLIPRTPMPSLRCLTLGPFRSGGGPARDVIDIGAIAPHVQRVELHQIYAARVVVSAECDALCTLSVLQRSRVEIEVARARRLRKLVAALDVSDCPALDTLSVLANGHNPRLRITRLVDCPALDRVTVYGEIMPTAAALAALRPP